MTDNIVEQDSTEVRKGWQDQSNYPLEARICKVDRFSAYGLGQSYSKSGMAAGFFLVDSIFFSTSYRWLSCDFVIRDRAFCLSLSNKLIFWKVGRHCLPRRIRLRRML